MAEIRFKATRRNYESWRVIEKSGNLEFDLDPCSKDGIWLSPSTGERIFIDCNAKTGVFRIVFHEVDFDKQS